MKLVENPYVSAFTRDTLAQFGWRENDPIPADLGPLLVKIKEEIPASERVDVLIDAALMPEDKIEEVKKMLAAAKEAEQRQKKKRDRQPVVDRLSPEAAEIYESIDDAAEVIDDREEAAAAETTATEKEEPETTEPTPAASESENTAPASGFAGAPIPYCPRCGWDTRQKFEAEPSDRDKEDFLATLLGGTRFKKSYDLFGGKLRVFFRGLLAEENKLIYRQLVLDQQENTIATESEWFMQMMDYRLACSIERVEDEKGNTVLDVPALDYENFKADPDEPLATPLPAQLKKINTGVLAQEVTRRIVGARLRNFQRIVEGLEAMALEPSFWNGIE